MNIHDRLKAFRASMAQHHFNVYLVGSADPHQSEYVADRFKARAFLSGFDGSAGTLAITADSAFLWTDSRYWLAAERALEGSGIKLMRQGAPDCPTIPDWIAQSFEAGAVVSYDQTCTSMAFHQELHARLQPRKIRVEPGPDLLADLWSGRAPQPTGKVRDVQPLGYFKPRKEKLDDISSWLQERGIAWHLVSALDEVAWMLNLRGVDVEYNPVFYGYLLAGTRSYTLFASPNAVDGALADLLFEEGVSLADYESLPSYLQTLSAEDYIMLNPQSTSMLISENCAHMHQRVDSGPIAGWKSAKSAQEIEALRGCMTRDGVAMVEVLSTIDSGLEKGTVRTEYEAGELVKASRAKQERFISESFNPIVGFGGNGAVVHYSAPKTGSAKISGRGLVLIDTGGLYEDGTTDITRVLCSGEPTREEIEAYTLTLKGHVKLSRAVFPIGTAGQALDILAREAFWNMGRSYGHGTGHGVGFSLCVHEGPQRISPPSPAAVCVPLEPGVLLSNEPGYYVPGKFGVRIENLVVVRPHAEFHNFLCFETVTLCPYEPKLIDPELLDDAEKAWISGYNQRLRQVLGPLLSPAAREWLEKKTPSY